MPELIAAPSVVEAAGNKPKKIEEFVGRVNSNNEQISIARMSSPVGWEEPAQTPEFDEYTLVLSGTLYVESNQEMFKVQAGQAIRCVAGETVKYSTPEEPGAEYVAICLPAFSPENVHRDGTE